MELLNVGFLTSTYDRDRQTGGNGASAVRDKRGQAIDARIIIDIGVAIAENVHELNVFDHLYIGQGSHTEAQHLFERIHFVYSPDVATHTVPQLGREHLTEPK